MDEWMSMYERMNEYSKDNQTEEGNNNRIRRNSKRGGKLSPFCTFVCFVENSCLMYRQVVPPRNFFFSFLERWLLLFVVEILIAEEDGTPLFAVLLLIIIIY
jgi:hypothetical protein